MPLLFIALSMFIPQDGVAFVVHRLVVSDRGIYMIMPLCVCVCVYVKLLSMRSKTRAELGIHSISGWLSENWDENPRMCNISYSKLPPKVCACVNSRRDFWTTNLKSSVKV